MSDRTSGIKTEEKKYEPTGNYFKDLFFGETRDLNIAINIALQCLHGSDFHGQNGLNETGFKAVVISCLSPFLGDKRELHSEREVNKVFKEVVEERDEKGGLIKKLKPIKGSEGQIGYADILLVDEINGEKEVVIIELKYLRLGFLLQPEFNPIIKKVEGYKHLNYFRHPFDQRNGLEEREKLFNSLKPEEKAKVKFQMVKPTDMSDYANNFTSFTRTGMTGLIGVTPTAMIEVALKQVNRYFQKEPPLGPKKVKRYAFVGVVNYCFIADLKDYPAIETPHLQ